MPLYLRACSILLVAGCAASAPDAVGTTESGVTSVTATVLRTASLQPLHAGAAPVAASAAFGTHSFWANVGEKLRIDVAGGVPFKVYRVLDWRNYDRTPGLADFNAHRDDAVLVGVGSGAGILEATVDHTGYHVVAVGSPDDAQVHAYSVALAVERRPETVGVVSLGYANRTGCAVLASSKLKCWGNGVGDTLATMGAGLSAVSLPTGASSVSVGAAGNATAVAVRLEDGRVATWAAGEAPRLVGLADAAERVEGGACALLANGKVQCWSHSFLGSTAVGPALGWPGKQVRELRANPLRFCVRFDGGEYACADTTTAAAPAVAAMAIGPGEQVRSLALGVFEACLFTDAASYCTGGNGIAPKVVTAAAPGALVMTTMHSTGSDIDAVLADGSLWNRYAGGLPYWSRGPELGGAARFLASVNMLGDVSGCALLDDGRVKCFGTATGGLGLGDLVDRSPSDPNVMGENLPALDLGS